MSAPFVPFGEWSERPAATERDREDRIADRLCDLLFVADDMLSSEQFDAPGNESIHWIGVELRQVYTQVNEIIKKLSN